MPRKTAGPRRLAKVGGRPLRECDIGPARPAPRGPAHGLSLLRMKRHCHVLEDLITNGKAMQGAGAIISENMAADRIRSYGLRPPSRILLCGPPGTGKTLADQIAGAPLGRPFAYVAFDSLASPHPGETEPDMKRAFDYMGEQKMAVLFDELYSIGRGRGGPHEHGGLKRAVNSFMQMLDEYEGDTTVMAATSRRRMPDEAAWGRLDAALRLGLPDKARRMPLFEKCLGAPKRGDGIDAKILATAARGRSAAGIMRVCVAALRKSIVRGRETVGKDDVMRALLEQKRRKSLQGP